MYRIDAVWLGPPRATFPWRARYVSYGVGLLVMMLIMFAQRRLGVPLDFFSIAWALVGTVAITRLLGKKITFERPFGQVVTQFWSEVTGPRKRTTGGGGHLRAGHVRVRSTRSAPVAPRRAAADRRAAAAPRATAEVAAGQTPPQSAVRDGRAAPVRTAPDAWSTRRSRPATTAAPARRTGRTTKEARRGRG
ncbi:hypothetical protein [Pseudonocardia endophytica]|uniref:hypothetical protein n=1 Tax=Pseudonocardia endophytica TaxID=401976 RepID=UPI001A9FBE71|nr:hypothetical protein [Pseudonocardia endophytica]